MRNIKLLIQYDGSRYSGWQSQGNTDNTIQAKLTAVLGRMTGEEIELQGSGRTDAGVHAAGQTANFKTRSALSCGEMVTYVNQYLPEDIAVLEAEEVDLRFHSRLGAMRKTYVYRIWNSPIPNVFERKFLCQVEEPLDTEAMKRAAKFLLGTHDFKAFSSLKKTKKSTVRTLDSIALERHGKELRLIFTGNGFLYHMVRILTGTLLEVGMGKRRAEEMAAILASLDREQAGFLAPAQGLCLWSVGYANSPEPGKLGLS